jgi:hypothetical protein
MKWFFLLLCFFAFGCETANFGYRNNPVEIMHRARKAIHANNLTEFKKNLSRHALCQWGNEAALGHLKTYLPSDIKKLIPQMTLVESNHLKMARFVGYWAYYEDVYHAQIVDVNSRILLGEARIECHFGNQGSKREIDRDMAKLSFSEKHCRVAVLKARSFDNPSYKKDCDTFSDKL